jgi:hypothetical protein
MPAGELSAGLRLTVPFAGEDIAGVAMLGTGAAVVTVQVVVTPPRARIAVYPVVVAPPVVPRIWIVCPGSTGIVVPLAGIAAKAPPPMLASIVVRVPPVVVRYVVTLGPASVTEAEVTAVDSAWLVRLANEKFVGVVSTVKL